MLYDLVLGLDRISHLYRESLHSLVTRPKEFIGMVRAVVKDEETIQQAQDNIEMGDAKLELNLRTGIKQVALSSHDFI